VELGIIESIPLVGAQIRDILTGGGGVATPTVLHMYMLHSYVLPLVAVGLAVVHLGGLLVQERELQGAIARLPMPTPEAGNMATPSLISGPSAAEIKVESGNPGAGMAA
jgi:cytochrome b6